MRRPLCLLLPVLLSAQEGGQGRGLTLNLKTALEEDPASRILLAPKGCWDGLLLRSTAPSPPVRKRKNEATVEVWDVAFHESPRQETFRLFREALLLDIAQALALPLTSYAQQDLAIIGGYVARHGSAAGVDNAVVQALQNRFNALPPNGSPVRLRSVDASGRYRTAD